MFDLQKGRYSYCNFWLQEESAIEWQVFLSFKSDKNLQFKNESNVSLLSLILPVVIFSSFCKWKALFCNRYMQGNGLGNGSMHL